MKMHVLVCEDTENNNSIVTMEEMGHDEKDLMAFMGRSYSHLKVISITLMG